MPNSTGFRQTILNILTKTEYTTSRTAKDYDFLAKSGHTADNQLLFASPYLSLVRLEEPCDGCAAPYGYHNIMPLTTDVQYFAVSQARLLCEYPTPVWTCSESIGTGHFYALSLARLMKQRLNVESMAQSHRAYYAL